MTSQLVMKFLDCVNTRKPLLQSRGPATGFYCELIETSQALS